MYLFEGNKISKMRAAVVDGEPRMVTMDYREDRINVELKNNVVIKIISNT